MAISRHISNSRVVTHPLDAPDFTLNALTVRAFNSVRHELKRMRHGPYRAHYDPFLYPLDGISQ